MTVFLSVCAPRTQFYGSDMGWLRYDMPLFSTSPSVDPSYFCPHIPHRHNFLRVVSGNLGEIGWDGVDWVDLAQDRDQWRPLVITVMNLRVP
jgi:hypothetical protein